MRRRRGKWFVGDRRLASDRSATIAGYLSVGVGVDRREGTILMSKCCGEKITIYGRDIRLMPRSWMRLRGVSLFDRIIVIEKEMTIEHGEKEAENKGDQN